RITADGVWYRCLYATNGTDLRKLVRGAARIFSASRNSAGAAADAATNTAVSTAADAAIARVIEEAWRGREDRGAEERAAGDRREPFIKIEELRRDPHLEMHTRGG